MSRSSRDAKRRYYDAHRAQVRAYLQRTRAHRKELERARTQHMLAVIRAAWRPIRG